MPNILEQYGIREVADVTFYKLDSNGNPTAPVLFLDTLKVSTIEQTGEEAEARGGKGNPPIIIWDYNKEINVTLEDALFSPKSMAIMFGNGTVVDYKTEGESKYLMRTELRPVEIKQTGTGEEATFAIPQFNYKWVDQKGLTRAMINPKIYNEHEQFLGVVTVPQGGEGDTTNAPLTETDDGYLASLFKNDDTTAKTSLFVTYDIMIEGSVIEISANSFPGAYYVVGETYARSAVTGEDELFQFIIPKAKIQSENTITLEAEGDPSVFNMSLRVMRPANGKMMQLVKYKLSEDGDERSDTVSIPHNHIMTEENMPDEDNSEQNVTEPAQG